MSAKFFVPLQEIDKAIRINCHIDHSAFKTLTLVKDGNSKNQGVGRLLFIYVASRLGFDREVICDFLAITEAEYNNKTSMLPEIYKTGEYCFTNKRNQLEEHEESCLVFYRKLLLIGNYLRYKYGYEL